MSPVSCRRLKAGGVCTATFRGGGAVSRGFSSGVVGWILSLDGWISDGSIWEGWIPDCWALDGWISDGWIQDGWIQDVWIPVRWISSGG